MARIKKPVLHNPVHNWAGGEAAIFAPQTPRPRGVMSLNQYKTVRQNDAEDGHHMVIIDSKAG